MVVHTRSRELLAWLVPHLANFPRAHRHTFTRHIADLCLGMNDALIAARHLEPVYRSQALRDADIQLDQLRQYLHLVWQWQWLNNGQYQHVSGLTAEVGRLIGGWRRAG
jgi:hypothetical protein